MHNSCVYGTLLCIFAFLLSSSVLRHTMTRLTDASSLLRKSDSAQKSVAMNMIIGTCRPDTAASPLKQLTA